jgi:hypothetical protein
MNISLQQHHFHLNSYFHETSFADNSSKRFKITRLSTTIIMQMFLTSPSIIIYL